MLESWFSVVVVVSKTTFLPPSQAVFEQKGEKEKEEREKKGKRAFARDMMRFLFYKFIAFVFIFLGITTR